MYKKIVPLNSKLHSGKKIKPLGSFKFAEKQNIASLIIGEFYRTAGIYPIVFVKTGDMFMPFALLGFKQGENLFIDENGQWKASYIPAVIRRYPFVLGKTEKRDDMMLCIDEESGMLSDDEGEALFDAEGKPSKIVENAREFLTEVHRSGEFTNKFAKELTDRELLSPLEIKITEAGETMNVAGCLAVNEKRFNELDDEDFLKLRKMGALPLIYAHLLSLNQLNELIQMKQK